MNNNIWLQEEYVEIRKSTDGERHGILIDDSGVFETRYNNKSELYREMVRKHGRCTGKIWVGDDKPKHIGWVFVKRMKYADCNKTYLQETWVTLHSGEPTKTIEYHYL